MIPSFPQPFIICTKPNKFVVVVVGKEIELKEVQVLTVPECHPELEFAFVICRACPVTRLSFLTSSSGTVLLCIPKKTFCGTREKAEAVTW